MVAVAEVQEPTGSASEQSLPATDEEVLAALDATLSADLACSWLGCPGVAKWVFRCRVCRGMHGRGAWCDVHVEVAHRRMMTRVPGSLFPPVLQLECGGVGLFAALFVTEQIVWAGEL